MRRVGQFAYGVYWVFLVCYLVWVMCGMPPIKLTVHFYTMKVSQRLATVFGRIAIHEELAYHKEGEDGVHV